MASSSQNKQPWRMRCLWGSWWLAIHQLTTDSPLLNHSPTINWMMLMDAYGCLFRYLMGVFHAGCFNLWKLLRRKHRDLVCVTFTKLWELPLPQTAKQLNGRTTFMVDEERGVYHDQPLSAWLIYTKPALRSNSWLIWPKMVGILLTSSYQPSMNH